MNLHRLPALALVVAMGIATRPVFAQAQTGTETEPSTPSAAPPPEAESGVATPRPATDFEGRIAKELGIPGGLTSRDVAERAIATSYVLEAQRADIARASAQVDRAFAAYIPRLELVGRYTRISKVEFSAADLGGPEGQSLENLSPPSNQWAFQAHLTIPVSDYFLRVNGSHKATKFAQSAAQKTLAANELSANADARTTYYAWVQARLSMVVAASALEAASAHLVDVKHAFDAGSASQADVLGIEARVADSERLLAINQNLVSRLEEQLRILRHDPPGTSYRVGEKLEDRGLGDGRLSAVNALQELTNEALRQRPELLALEAQIQASRSRATVERAAAYPRLDLFANAAYDRPNQRYFVDPNHFRGTWDAGVQASWVISDIPGALAAGRGETAVAATLMAQRQALADQIRNEVTTAYTALLDAQASLATTGRSLAAAEEAHRVRRVLFQNGRATSVEVMDAELELTRARLVAVSARIDLATARVRLDYALGRKGQAASSG